jgi:hypothetical protein
MWLDIGHLKAVMGKLKRLMPNEDFGANKLELVEMDGYR